MTTAELRFFTSVPTELHEIARHLQRLVEILETNKKMAEEIERYKSEVEELGRMVDER